MALAAAQVVDALAARVAPLAALGGRVKTSRTWPWSEAELPAARVFATQEDVEPVMLDGTNQHTLEVLVQITARASQDLDDSLHALAAGALPLLFAAPAPYALQLTAIERDLATEGEAAVGRISLVLRAVFCAAPTAPETITSL